MGLYQILYPEAAINLVANPSLEEATTGWAAVGGSIAASAAYARRGSKSLAVTPTAGTGDGVYYASVSLTNGTVYTLSVDVKGVNGVPYQVYFATGAGALKGTATSFVGNGDWQRVSVTWTADATAAHRVYVIKNSDASTGVFYVDGLLVWAGDHDTSYLDGGMGKGYAWSGAAHASTSTRSAQVRNAGRKYDLADLGFYVTEITGGGMPDVELYLQERAMLPGAQYNGFGLGVREFALIGDAVSTTRAGLHGVRKDVIDLIRPDVTATPQAFTLVYTGANTAKEVRIECVYGGGMGMGKLDGFSETISLRLVSSEPYWYEEGNTAAALTTAATLTADYIIGKVAGVWTAFAGMTGTVYGTVAGPDGTLYAYGNFTNAGTDANADYIAKWDGAAWVALTAAGGANGWVYDAVVDARGYLYAVGKFTSIGGVAANYIAYWDGTNWNAIGAGLNTNGRSIVIGTDGAFYIGGDFTAAGGGAANYFCKLVGTTFSACGSGITGDYVAALCATETGKIGVLGKFTAAVDSVGTKTTDDFVVWDIATSTYINPGMVVTATPDYGIAITAGVGDEMWISGVWIGDYTYIVYWNGSNLVDFSADLNSTPWGLFYDRETGLLYACGGFTLAGGVSVADRLAVWDRSTWRALDVNLPGTPDVYDVRVLGGNLYVGYSTSGTASGSYLNTISNPGTMQAWPVIKIKRSGGTSAVVEWLKNEISGKTLHLNYSLMDGETLTIDCRPGMRSVSSSWFGAVWRALLRASELATFGLQGGSNPVSVFVNSAGSPTITASMEWVVRHWSLDGVAA